jgi:hypothetical protein
MVNPIFESSKLSEEQLKILQAIMKTDDYTIFLGLLKLRIQWSMDDLIDDLEVLKAHGFILLDPPSILIKESPDLLCRFRLTNTGKQFLVECLNEFIQNHQNSGEEIY